MKNDGNDDEGYSVPCDDRDNDNGRDEELTCYSNTHLHCHWQKQSIPLFGRKEIKCCVYLIFHKKLINFISS